MKSLGVFVVGALVFVLYATTVLSTQEWAFEGEIHWKHVLEDVHDRGVYQQRGRWLPAGVAPYVGEHSEYPQIATWMLAVPYLFFDHHVPDGGYDQTKDERTGRRRSTATEREHLAADRDSYFDAFHVMMLVVGLVQFALVLLLLRTFGASPLWALLVVMPASLYFTLNRYDIVPAVFVSGALLALFSERMRTAAFLLALGAMSKWYPILLLPLFVSYECRRRARAGEAFGQALGGGLVAPLLVAGATCAALLAVTWFWDGGGLDAVTYVYSFHAGRAPNPASLVSALTAPHRWGLLSPDTPWLETATRALQFGPALVLALLPIRSRDALLWACLVVVAGFVTFSKVFSPQWILWFGPIAVLLVARARGLLALLVALEILIYVQMPVMFYARPAEATGEALMRPIDGFWAVMDARILVLVSFWAWSLAMFLRTVRAGSTDEGGPGRPAGAAEPSAT